MKGTPATSTLLPTAACTRRSFRTSEVGGDSANITRNGDGQHPRSIEWQSEQYQGKYEIGGGKRLGTATEALSEPHHGSGTMASKESNLGDPSTALGLERR